MSESPEAPSKGTELHVVLVVPEPTVRPGDKVKANAHVYATGPVAKGGRLKVTADGGVGAAPACGSAARGCDLGDITAEGELIPVELSVPAKAKPGTLRVTTAVSAQSAPAKTVVHLLTVAEKDMPAPSATPTPSTSATPSTPSTAAAPPAVPPAGPPAASPHSALPSGVPQAALPTASPSDGTDGGLPPIVADASPTARPLDAPQNVAAIRSDVPGPDTDAIVRAQAVWLGVLLALFTALAVRLRRQPFRGAHRRTSRGKFAR
ncbi:hypothetical protein [Actinocorallia libanotica]|uniref:hypothetical protein n=1 Tax=Actinocorallia libanotica TaxID=46162 RepID=UPI0031DBAC2F